MEASRMGYPPSKRYRWRLLADGQTKTLKRGKDFKVAAKNFACNAHQWANRHGYLCKVRIPDDNTVELTLTSFRKLMESRKNRKLQSGKDFNHTPEKLATMMAAFNKPEFNCTITVDSYGDIHLCKSH